MAGLGVNAQGQFADVLSGSYGTVSPGNTAAAGTPDQVSQEPLVVGPVIFRSFECPSEISIGAGIQKTVTHEVVGGSRVIQAFGAFIDPVSFSGTLWQPYLDDRVTALRQMLVSAKEVSISWRREFYAGLVTKFKPTYHHASKCSYEIEFEVTQDKNGAFTIATATGVDSTVAALNASAKNSLNDIALIDPAGGAGLGPRLSDLNGAIQNAGPIAQAAGTPEGAALTKSAGDAVSSTQSYISTIDPAGSSILPATQLLNALTLIKANVQRGQSPRTVRSIGGSLFEMASTTYGDITRAFALMSANGLPAPMLPSTTQSYITLPPYSLSPLIR